MPPTSQIQQPNPGGPRWHARVGLFLVGCKRTELAGRLPRCWLNRHGARICGFTAPSPLPLPLSTLFSFPFRLSFLHLSFILILEYCRFIRIYTDIHTEMDSQGGTSKASHLCVLVHGVRHRDPAAQTSGNFHANTCSLPAMGKPGAHAQHRQGPPRRILPRRPLPAAGQAQHWQLHLRWHRARRRARLRRD